MVYSADFQSLSQYQCPQWFRDAKFGIWSHWGPQSVPMFGDWYARHMYEQGHPCYLYHLRHYGHPSQFGYKDICKLWKAEKFNPDELMELYVQAGARYFVAQAMHHDHFFNYPSKLNRFNSMEVGPHQDICGKWKAAAQKFGLPFGLTEHLSASFSWWNTNKGADTWGPYAGVPYDGNDPEYRDFYYDNYEHVTGPQSKRAPWYTTNPQFHDYWLRVIKELIDRYQPDLLYSDGGLPFGQDNNPAPLQDKDYLAGLEAVSYLYNQSVSLHGENRAIYNQKDKRPEVYKIGVLDVERSQLAGISPDPWQTDTCIGGWFYDAKQELKRPGHILEMLVDIVSKNGNLLLNILQRPDGSIDDETRWILQELANWFRICGEGIYGTHPWRVFGEGNGLVILDGHREDEVAWTPSDFRFTCKGDTLYAFQMRCPENRVAILQSLRPDEKVLSVKLLGVDSIPFQQAFGVLTMKLPQKLPTDYINCFAIEFQK